MAIDRETQVLTEAYAAGIRSPRELANFMAQVTHESNGLNRLEESFRYTRNISQIPVQSAWREGPEALESARLQALQGRPERLAELMYGGRNGNDAPGDGWRYHGRGYIQLTGKDNYRAAGEALDLDLVKHPELAADPQNASRIAVWYWENRVPEQAREDVRAATHAVNGKYNGLEDRQTRFHDWERRLTPEVMQRLEHGAASLPTHSSHSAPAHHADHSSTLRTGAHGDEVRTLQASLAGLGYTDAHRQPLQVDGKFGPGTQAALEAFQRDHHLAADGVAGPKTRAALDAATRQPVVRLDDPSHPDHALFEQARAAVHKLDAEHHRTPDQQSENLAAALTVAAKKEGMTSIDRVVLSDDASRVYAVAGDTQSPHKRVADVQTAQAVNTPVDLSASALPQARPEQATAPAPQQQTNAPTHPGMGAP
ncbi:XVIPCD domain-containing protein [Luteibacter sp. UNCMF366Tsu5.1]|uniref:XVIPCD domain-containing protein n=1 Tax=Luteibacter sp. UNCMF366Tsu5.1 TaxID=1502758 RepID=UPI000908DDEA|nr:XVIPCD domain-containing protein [Luteibacter sp. UNCMF366Tsu5.1]SFW62873.1 putative chitinase [Luteibacter sp. UNCMF366Tsu5.1]